MGPTNGRWTLQSETTIEMAKCYHTPKNSICRCSNNLEYTYIRRWVFHFFWCSTLSGNHDIHKCLQRKGRSLTMVAKMYWTRAHYTRKKTFGQQFFHAHTLNSTYSVWACNTKLSPIHLSEIRAERLGVFCPAIQLIYWATELQWGGTSSLNADPIHFIQHPQIRYHQR